MSIDNGLFLYVEQCCLLGENKDYNVYIMSNETLLQIDYTQHLDGEKLHRLVEIYRNEQRKVMYFNQKDMHLVRQSSKLSNQEIIDKITYNPIQIVY